MIEAFINFTFWRYQAIAIFERVYIDKLYTTNMCNEKKNVIKNDGNTIKMH